MTQETAKMKQHEIKLQDGEEGAREALDMALLFVQYAYDNLCRTNHNVVSRGRLRQVDDLLATVRMDMDREGM